MKKIILLVILITVSQISKGQLSPVLPYNNLGQPLDTIKALALGTSAKSLAFRNCIVENIKDLLKDTLVFSEENLGWAFQYFFSEEVVLKAGEYQNSGWNAKTGKIEFFSGKDFTGFVWIFRIGSYETVICKGNCANPLNVTEQKIVQQQQQQTQIVLVSDTVKQTVYLTDTVVAQTSTQTQTQKSSSMQMGGGTNIYVSHPNYYKPMQMGGGTNISVRKCY